MYAQQTVTQWKILAASFPEPQNQSINQFNQSIKNLKHAICRYRVLFIGAAVSLGGDKSSFKQMSLKMFSECLNSKLKTVSAVDRYTMSKKFPSLSKKVVER